MALDPENYINVYVSLARAMFEQQIPIVVAAELAHFSAQPATEVAIHDVLDELKAELYDWIPSDLNALKESEIITISGPSLEDGQPRCAQLAHLVVDGGWHGGLVHASRVDINDAIEKLSRRYVPEGVDVEKMFCASSGIDFATAASKFREAVETEITKFREELDFLYPYPEEGGKT